MTEAAPAPAQDLALVAVDRVPADRHPAAVYIASLAPGSRRTMRQALDAMAGAVTNGQATAETLDWSGLRYQHTQAVRAGLTARYAPATANKMLAGDVRDERRARGARCVDRPPWRGAGAAVRAGRQGGADHL